jgi:hypothetical protein
MTTALKKYPDDRKANPRLDTCRVCNGEIFFLDFKDGPGWWHELPELDLAHEAKPKKVNNERD